MNNGYQNGVHTIGYTDHTLYIFI